MDAGQDTAVDDEDGTVEVLPTEDVIKAAEDELAELLDAVLLPEEVDDTGEVAMAEEELEDEDPLGLSTPAM